MDWILTTTQKNFVDVWKQICFIAKYYLFNIYISGNKMKMLTKDKIFLYWYSPQIIQ